MPYERMTVPTCYHDNCWVLVLLIYSVSVHSDQNTMKIQINAQVQ